MTIIDNVGNDALRKTGSGKSYFVYQKGDKIYTTIFTIEKGGYKNSENKEGAWVPDGEGEKDLTKEKKQGKN